MRSKIKVLMKGPRVLAGVNKVYSVFFVGVISFSQFVPKCKYCILTAVRIYFPTNTYFISHYTYFKMIQNLN